MGVAVCFPTNKYNLTDSDIQCISMFKAWPDVQHSLWTKAVNSVTSIVRALATWFGVKSQDDPWELARGRDNVAIMVSLQTKLLPQLPRLHISTYHMPCMFKLPPMMMIHAALVGQWAQQHANGEPLVLTGDFNFTPSSAMYELMTTGSTKRDHPKYKAHDSWRAELPKPFRSAAAVALGSEPEATTAVKWAKGDFVGALDYMFFCGNITPTLMKPLPRAPDGGPLFTPCATESSDHLPLEIHFEQPLRNDTHV